MHDMLIAFRRLRCGNV